MLFIANIHVKPMCLLLRLNEMQKNELKFACIKLQRERRTFFQFRVGIDYTCVNEWKNTLKGKSITICLNTHVTCSVSEYKEPNERVIR